MEIHPWSGLAAGVIALLVIGWFAAGVRARFRGRHWWWRGSAFALGAGVAVAFVTSPIDALGEDGLLTAHIAQHVALGDLAAPLLLLGMPPSARSQLAGALGRLAASRRALARLATAALSPRGAVLVWTLVTYLWFVPALHRAAVADGPVHFLDHVSFLMLGGVIWLAAFDPRSTRDVKDGLRLGGLPWWARHVYAMVTRLAMLVPAFAVWLAAPDTYYPSDQPLPFGLSRAGDQVRAASVMIGFEMLLFGLAVVLAFIFVSVSEGRERRRSQEGSRRFH